MTGARVLDSGLLEPLPPRGQPKPLCAAKRWLKPARALYRLPEAVRDALAPQKVFPGNQPSNRTKRLLRSNC